MCHDLDIPKRVSVRQVVEVFPHPASVSLFDLDRSLKYKARKGRDYSQRWVELIRLGDLLVSLDAAEPPLHLSEEVASLEIEGRRGGRLKEAEDLLDSIVCAYSVLYAWYHGPRYYAVYGTPPAVDRKESGHILVPMTAGMWKRIKTSRLLILDRDGAINRRFGGRPPN